MRHGLNVHAFRGMKGMRYVVRSVLQIAFGALVLALFGVGFARGEGVKIKSSAAEALQGGLLNEAEVQRRTQAISDRLRCPTCQAVSVRESQSAFAQQIQSKVERMVREGQSEQAIIDYFRSRYGVWILRAPPREGIGWLLWGFPLFALLFGVIGLCWWYLRFSKRDTAAHAETVDVLPNQRNQIWDAVLRYDGQDRPKHPS